MTRSLEGLDWRVILVGLLGALLAVLMSYGCILNPGAQVREALSQTKTYEWTSEGSIRVHGIGPQEESFLMMEGSIVLGETGEIDWAASNITHYLRSEPSADEAMAGLATAFVALAEQQRIASETWSETLRLIASVVPSFVAPPAAGEGEGD